MMNKNIIIAILIIIIIAVGAVLIFGQSSGKADTQINFLNKNTVQNGDQVKFELKDASGNPIAGVTVNLTYNNNEKYSVITDSSGRGYLTLNGESAGNYDVVVDYGGSDKYNPCTAKMTITISEGTASSTASSTATQTSGNSVANTNSYNSGGNSGYADADGGQGLGSHPFENETPVNESIF